jgi:probable phosphoglycerate mutase
MSVTYILLIRHGENDFTKSQRMAGRLPGVRLNEGGRSQAAALVHLLADQPLHAIYSSPLERCQETAAPLAATRTLPLALEPDLAEVLYGEWEGAELKDLTKLPDWQAVQHYPSTFRFPGGETLREVQQRAVAVVERLRREHPNQIVALFSHGDVIRTTLAHYLGVPLDLFQRIVISTASVSIVGFMHDRPFVVGLNYQTTPPKVEIPPERPPADDAAIPERKDAASPDEKFTVEPSPRLTSQQESVAPKQRTQVANS